MDFLNDSHKILEANESEKSENQEHFEFNGINWRIEGELEEYNEKDLPPNVYNE